MVSRSIIHFSGLSGDCSGMPKKTRLSLLLRDCRSRMDSVSCLFSVMMDDTCVWRLPTDCWRVLFTCLNVSMIFWVNSRLSRNAWNSLCIISMSEMRASNLSRASYPVKWMSLTSRQQVSVGEELALLGESEVFAVWCSGRYFFSSSRNIAKLVVAVVDVCFEVFQCRVIQRLNCTNS